MRDLINALVSNLQSQGRDEETVPLFERAVALLEKSAKPDIVDLGGAFGSLARVHDKLGRYDEAERAHERRIALIEKLRGPEDTLLQYLLSDLAFFYQQRRRYDDAAQLYERAIAIEEKASAKTGSWLMVRTSRLLLR